MTPHSRDALVWFAAGAVLALLVVRGVPAAVRRVACGAGACTTSVARARTTIPPAPHDATEGAQVARNDAVPGASSPQRELGPGVYVMRAPEATAAPGAPSSPPSEAEGAAPSPDAMLLAKRDDASPAPPPLLAAPAAPASDETASAAPPAAAPPQVAAPPAGAGAEPPQVAAPPAPAAQPPGAASAEQNVDAARDGRVPTETSPPEVEVASNAKPLAATPPAAAPPRNDARSEPAVGPLDGWWLVTNAAESSHRRPESGLLVYRIELRQDGYRVFGKGSTWSKNGQVLLPSQRTPVVVTGTWRDNRIQLVLIEHGRRGTRQGRVDWQPTPDGEAFEGRFVNESTDAIGRSEAVRELSAPVEEAQQRTRAEQPRRRRYTRWR